MNALPVHPASQLKRLRQLRAETQRDFWSRFGVSQSRGSRYEKGGELPAPVGILLALYLSNKISDHDLHEALELACIDIASLDH